MSTSSLHPRSRAPPLSFLRLRRSRRTSSQEEIKCMAVKVKQHKGKWWVFIDHKGKRKAKCVGSKQAAETAAKKIEAKLTLGDFTLLDEKPQRPFDDYFKNWLDTYVKAHCKERTYDLYEDIFRIHLLPHFGQKDIAAITREEVKQLAYGLLAKGK